MLPPFFLVRDLKHQAQYLSSLLVGLGLIVLSVFTPAGTSTAAGPPVSSSNEVRALWVVRTTLTSPEKIHQMVENAYAAGFNTLIVQVRGRGDAYYRSRHEPR